MPMYEFRCEPCDHAFETLVRGPDDVPHCPKCRGTALRKQFSVPAASRVSLGGGGSFADGPAFFRRRRMRRPLVRHRRMRRDGLRPIDQAPSVRSRALRMSLIISKPARRPLRASSLIQPSTFFSAEITVEWFRPPKKRPISL